jgi:hypothetical protein
MIFLSIKHSLQQHFKALDNQAIALIEQQFRRNQQDWQKRRLCFSRLATATVAVGRAYNSGTVNIHSVYAAGVYTHV